MPNAVPVILCLVAVIAGIINIIFMEKWAASEIGPFPALLPLYLAGISLLFALASLFLTVECVLEKERQWCVYLIASLLWIGLIAINLYYLQSVMYAA